VAAVLGLSGCATLSENECRTANWYELGERDGYSGYRRARLEDHREACAEYRIEADAEAYERGRSAGLLRYCTPERGYTVGKTGSSYSEVCPPQAETSFLQGYEMGREVYRAGRSVEDLEAEVRRAEDKLGREESAEERDRLRRRIHNIDAELLDARSRLRRLQQEALDAGF